MVAEALILINGGGFGGCRDLGRGDLVIDAPAYILGPCLPAVAPPGVGFAQCLRVQASVDIDPADFIEDPRQPGAFLWQETAVLHVAFPVLEVDFLVGDVPVAAQDDLASAL